MDSSLGTVVISEPGVGYDQALRMGLAFITQAGDTVFICYRTS